MANQDSYFCDGAFSVPRFGVLVEMVVTGFKNPLPTGFLIVTDQKAGNHSKNVFLSRLQTLNYGIILHHSEHIRAYLVDTRVLAVRLW